MGLEKYKNITAVLLASGSGSRANSDIPKQFCKIGSPPRTLLEHIVLKFSKFLETMIITLPNYELDELINKEINDLVKNNNANIILIRGGNTRYESAQKALSLVQTEYICIHDVARALLDERDLENILEQSQKYNACILAKPVTDTIKQINKTTNTIEKTIDRDRLYMAQTPQIFLTDEYRDATDKIQDQNITDDASILEFGGGRNVNIVEAMYANPKLTFEEDFLIFDYIVQSINDNK